MILKQYIHLIERAQICDLFQCSSKKTPMLSIVLLLLEETATFWVQSCERFVDADLSWMNGCNRICTNGKQMVFLRHDSSCEFVSWRIGCNWMCTNGRQTAFCQYESSCEFVIWYMTLHDNCKQGRHQFSCPTRRWRFDTETIHTPRLAWPTNFSPSC